MRRILVVSAIVLLTALAGCTSGGAGSFELLLSDQRAAIGDFDSLTVSFDEARVFSGTGNESGFETISLDDASVDLTQVQGAMAQSLINTSLETGTYQKIELYASDIEGIVDGSEVAVKIPPGKLMITKPFTIQENETTQFVFDIQVVLRGNAQNNQGYILKPVISESGVADEDVEMERAGREGAGGPAG